VPHFGPDAPEVGFFSQAMPKTKSSQPAHTLSNELWRERFQYFVERNESLVQTIRELVEIESPSDNKQAGDHMGAVLAGRFESLGGRAKIHRSDDYADNLQIDFPVATVPNPFSCSATSTPYILSEPSPTCHAAPSMAASTAPVSST
jgi:hypothetical protein